MIQFSLSGGSKHKTFVYHLYNYGPVNVFDVGPTLYKYYTNGFFGGVGGGGGGGGGHGGIVYNCFCLRILQYHDFNSVCDTM